MDRALKHQEDKKSELVLQNQPIISRNSNPSSSFSFFVSKSVNLLKNRVKLASRVSSKRFNFDGMLVNNSVYGDSPSYLESKMEDKEEGFCGNEVKVENFVDLSGESCDFLASDLTLNDENSSSEDSSSTPSVGWPMKKDKMPHSVSSEVLSQEVGKAHFDKRKLEKQGSSLSESEMMKERFSKLLLGEDMSGCGNGVCTALAISNAITNLCATLFGQVWRLEPLQPKKKLMWRREMEWLLCVSDHIVELIPSWQTFPDGTKLEVMTSRPRLDLFINLPALRKLDNMLLEILDSFESCEFWYVDRGIVAPETDGSCSYRKPLPHQEDKWWLPVPRVPPGGLSDDARKMIQHKRDCTNQILKATMAINNAALAEMNIPHSYLESLPKNGRTSVGDVIYQYISSDQFTPECLLDCLDLSSDHHALEIANRVEGAIYAWRRKTSSSKPPLNSAQRSNSKSSWEMVKDLVSDVDKREQLADRAESLLLCLKQRFPGLPQTTLDMSKIQYNKDVGKSILESYSRVLESLAFNIMARINDLLYVDGLCRHSEQLISISKVGAIAQKTIEVPYKTAFSTPGLSPVQLISPAKGDIHSHRSPYKENSKILTDYVSIHGKMSMNTKGSESFSSTTAKISASPLLESSSDQQEMSPLRMNE